MNYEELITCIKSRCSIRSFIPDYYISDEDINKLLDAAKHSPSARNIQPIEFIVVRDKKTLKALCEPCQQKQTAEVSVAIVIIGDILLARKVSKLSSHSATTAEKGDGVFLYMDTAAATQNILLAATALGIDSLWISSFHEKLVADLLTIPETYKPLVIIPLGKRKNEPFCPPKRSISERIHINAFESISHDYSYLEISKMINEVNGELKNYLELKYDSALRILKDSITQSEFLEHKNNFLVHSQAVSKKCFNIAKLLKKRKYRFINEEEMCIVGLLHDIGKCFRDDDNLHELAGAEYLASKGYYRIANIVGSHFISLEKIYFFSKRKIPNISRYVIDNIEKEILTFSELTTNHEGKDIPFEENINQICSNTTDDVMKGLLLSKKDYLRDLCEKVESKINQ